MRSFLYLGRLRYLKKIKLNQALLGDFAFTISLETGALRLSSGILSKVTPNFGLYNVLEYQIKDGDLKISKAVLIETVF
tara:strand:- start:991 stop:1227 length:237 start_codon:yes stop_codon:yes gene_type:complete